MNFAYYAMNQSRKRHFKIYGFYIVIVMDIMTHKQYNYSDIKWLLKIITHI